MESATTSTTKWALDPTHSEVHFKIRHLMISTVTGAIGKFEGSAETNGDDFTNAKVNFSADSSSITSGDAQRDGHLATADFFDHANHPNLTFESTSFEKVSEGNYTMNGNLTIKGTTKLVALNVEFAGIATDPWGNVKAGFNVTGSINRKDFGVNWNAALETGGFLLADEVKINCEVQLAKQN
ncbi:MAG: YceI family protein [Bacteroidia bacterium]|nr:YceI family protein [Bacteroidia bacterium]